MRGIKSFAKKLKKQKVLQELHKISEIVWSIIIIIIPVVIGM